MATDPIYSEETVARSKDGDVNFCRPGYRRYRRYKGSSFGANVSKPKGSTRKPLSRGNALYFKAHVLNECSEFLKKPLTERKNFMKEKGSGFGCYSTVHIANLYLPSLLSLPLLPSLLSLPTLLSQLTCGNSFSPIYYVY